MLKIKDNVDLKELETQLCKRDYHRVLFTNYLVYQTTDSLITLNLETRKLNLYILNYGVDDVYLQKIYDDSLLYNFIYDIKDLVEKVEE